MIFFRKSANFFVLFCFTTYTKRKCFTIEIEDGREAPCKPNKTNLLIKLLDLLRKDRKKRNGLNGPTGKYFTKETSSFKVSENLN